MEIKVLGIDLAKTSFQLHGADQSGRKLFSKKFTRSKMIEFVAQLKPCLIAMEACGSSHHFARKFKEMGHEVKLMAPQFVKPFVKSQKNDSNDAEAIVEAALRPQMRFVAIKSVEQQDVQILHRVRSRLMAERTALVNEIRGLLLEYGVVVAKGPSKLKASLNDIIEDASTELTIQTRNLLSDLKAELKQIEERVESINEKIKEVFNSSESAKRIAEIEGVGILSATAIVAAVGDAKQFKNSRQLSAWLGLVPRQNSTGGRTQLLGISKRGDSYLRTLLIHGGRSVVRVAKNKTDKRSEWIKDKIQRRGVNRTSVAIANKNARIIWKLLTSGESYRTAI